MRTLCVIMEKIIYMSVFNRIYIDEYINFLIITNAFSFLFLFFSPQIDVPDGPERPLITSFTSRSMNLSWAHSQEPRNAPVTHFLIETR